jgi:tripartite-type tricarboxylate transporter receptor subunit TctC
LRQDWHGPARPIRTIVPFPAGGASDVVARIVCEQLSKQLGQPFVVENRSGAGGSIGAAVVAKSEPDGYTLMIHSISHTIAAATYAHLSYDATKDFSAVVSLGVMPNLLMVSPKKEYKSLRDLVEAAHKKPGAVSYGSAGVGSISHLSGERLKLAGKFQAVHVPYKGAPDALLDLMAGRIDFFFSPYLPAKPFMDGNTLSALAVASAKRSIALPDVPTTSESGYPDTEYPYWNAIFLPAKTPRTIVNRLHDETVKAMDITQDKLAKVGTEPMVTSPAEFDAIVNKQIAANVELVKLAGIKVN